MGLRLRKSPSLLDLIESKLSQGDKLVSNTKDDNLSSGVKKESRGPVEKLKASNFPAMVLRIGSWEVDSRFYVMICVLGNLFFLNGFNL